jgi:hypothetical protein
VLSAHFLNRVPRVRVRRGHSAFVQVSAILADHGANYRRVVLVIVVPNVVPIAPVLTVDHGLCGVHRSPDQSRILTVRGVVVTGFGLWRDIRGSGAS